MNVRTRADFESRRRAGFAAWTAAVVLLLVGGGPAAAQGTFYADLNAAVPGLASTLVADDRLAGKKVLVNVHDFFEERTGRSLPLSETLRQRFRTELSSRGVQVFALPEGSEDEMVILQGVWRELPEPGAGPESRKIDLVVSLIERTADGQRVLPAARGRIDAVDAGLLMPDLDSWGRYLVKGLERRAGGHGRRVVRVGDVHLDGVAEPERFRRYLERRWLLPAFSQSRLFRLAAGGDEESEGTLDVDVFVHAGQVEIALNVWDQGVQVAGVSIEMAQGLLPERYFRVPGTEAQGLGTAATTPGLVTEDGETPSPGVTALLAECAAHLGANRLTRPPGRNAAQCYAQVLELERGNDDALAGFARIEGRYVELARGAIGRGAFAEARGHVERLGKLNPEHPRVLELEGEIAGAEGEARRKREEERRQAEARRIAELTPEMVRIEGGSFWMGSPESEPSRDDDERRHRVRVEGFSIGKYEVTRGEYARFVRATGRATGDACLTYYMSGEWEARSGRSWRTPGYGQEDTHPVVCVSHEEAVAYARWVSEETGARYRLPTEAEWEYAARARTETAYPWGDDVGHNKANCYGCGSRWDNRQTAPVGSFDGNAWGVHDTVGNVWEWTCSEHDEGYGGAEQRCASGSDGRLVVRGGSWYSPPVGVRSANRYRLFTRSRTDFLGFRLVQD